MLASGSLISEYQVLGPLGAGGMGEVYRARDTRLGREVALKLLPDELAHNPEKRRRFEREARSLAAFHHAGIVTLYGFQEADGILCLVMELVEGPTLADRLKRGPLRLPEALRLAAQMAEALEAAHERGILHRDLKPSNIKITLEGHAKLIDFGLAKGVEPSEPDRLQSEKSTASEDPTAFGAVVGTAPYMSPEQARGEALDHRTDVWAFGCVLYEMLACRRAFPGSSKTEAVAAVLQREPDWDALPAETPPSIRRLLKRALEKNRTHRLHDIGDARLEIEEALVDLSSGVTAAAAAPAVRRRRTALLWTVGLLSAAVLIGLAVSLLLRASAPIPPTVTRLTFAPPQGVKLIGTISVGGSSFQHLALSPQGDRAAFVGNAEGKGRQLYLQAINDIEAHVIPNTEGAHSPFFSPEGRWLGYQQGKQLKKVSLDGGAALTIADIPQEGSLRGASWGEAGTIVFAPGPYEGLWRVPADGGKPQMITTPDRSKDEGHRWPQILPGGRDVLFTITAGSSSTRIGLLSLETGRWWVLLEKTGFARYSPTGHVIFARLGTLYAEPFDLSRHAVSGPAVPVLDDVQMALYGHTYADFDISPSGALLYVPGFPRPVERSLLWVDRQGRSSAATDGRQPYDFARLSPDGRQVAVTILSDPETANQWVFDLERRSRTLVAEKAGYAIWSPDGQWLAAVNAKDELVKIRSDGNFPSKVLSEPLGFVNPDAWSPDGRTLVLSQQLKDALLDIETLPAEGGKPGILLATPNIECCSALSPDGRFLAYMSKESGSYEIYVSPFPGPVDKRYRISAEGGFQPLFSRDGRELFYRVLGDRPKLMSVSIETREAFHASTPRPLFDDMFAGRTPISSAQYDISPDGRRFLFLEEPPAAPGPTRLVLMPDWARELRTKLRATHR